MPFLSLLGGLAKGFGKGLLGMQPPQGGAAGAGYGVGASMGAPAFGFQTPPQQTPQQTTPQAGVLGGAKTHVQKGYEAAGGVAGPQATAQNFQQLYSLLASSPMFANLLRSSIGAGQQAQTGIQSALGRTGLSQTGVGGLMGGLAGQLPAQGALQARAGLFQQALPMTLQGQQLIAQLLPELAKMSHGEYGKRGWSFGPIGQGPGLS